MAIDLPGSLKLQRNLRDEAALLKAAKDWLTKEERAEGIHASDLLDLRQSYYRHVDPRPLSERETTLFLVGKVLHAFVLGSMDSPTSVDIQRTDEGSQYSERLGLWYSPDWDKGDIAEFKTNRMFKEPKTVGDVDSYLEQTLIYMAAKQVTRAKLWVLLLNLRDENTRRTTPVFRCYSIAITPEDLRQVTESIRGLRDTLAAAVERRDPSDLPVCRAWKCGEGNCPYWGNPCKPEGRYGLDPKEWEQ